MAEDNARPLFPRWLVALAIIAAVVWLLLNLRDVLAPVFFAGMLAYMLDPLVDRLEKRRIPRALGVTIVLTGVLVVAALVSLLVLPGVIREVGVFVAGLPTQIARLISRVEPWLKEQGVETPHSIKDALTKLDINVKYLAEKAAAPAGYMVGVVVGGTASVLSALGNLFLIPIFAAYLLYDWDRMIMGIRELIPWRIRPYVVDVAGEVDDILGEFMRGQFLVMLILAVLYATAYSIIGVPLAIPIGIIAGLIAFIPYVGGAVALGLALLMSVLTGTSWTQVFLIVGVYTVIQILEGFIITPRIMENKLGIGAFWVLLALMVFGEFFGFIGVLLALPAAAVLKVLIIRVVGYYEKTDFFLRGCPTTGSRRSLLTGLLLETGLPDSPELAHQKRLANQSCEAGCEVQEGPEGTSTTSSGAPESSRATQPSELPEKHEPDTGTENSLEKIKSDAPEEPQASSKRPSQR